MPKTRVLGPPSGQKSLMEGVATLNRLLSLTLGPNSGSVAVSNSSKVRPIENHDDALSLSQRLLELPNPFQDMGSQLLRQALSAIGKRTLDGAATCSVITNAILRSARPLLAIGYDPNQLIRGLEVGRDRVLSDLVQGARTIDTMEEIESLLISACIESQMAKTVAEILDTVGPEGSLIVEETRVPGLAHEYVQGGRWTSGQVSPYLLTENEVVTTAHNPIVVVSACPILSVDQIKPILDTVSQTTSRSVVLVAPEFSDSVIGVLVVNRNCGALNSVIAVTAPRSVHFGPQVLEDISVLVGGRLIGKDETSGLKRLKAHEFGHASQAWASRFAFGVVGGDGDKDYVSMQRQAIRNQILSEMDPVKRKKLYERAGTLAGISAILRVGNHPTSRWIDGARQADKAAAIARHALQSGVVPGGGAALAHCAEGLSGLRATNLESIGVNLLADALYEPMRVILRNAGVPFGPIIDQKGHKAWNEAFDVIGQEWVDTSCTGLWDPLEVVKVALETAVSAASTVISTDTLVSHGAAAIVS